MLVEIRIWKHIFAFNSRGWCHCPTSYGEFLNGGAAACADKSSDLPNTKEFCVERMNKISWYLAVKASFELQDINHKVIWKAVVNSEWLWCVYKFKIQSIVNFFDTFPTKNFCISNFGQTLICPKLKCSKSFVYLLSYFK